MSIRRTMLLLAVVGAGCGGERSGTSRGTPSSSVNQTPAPPLPPDVEHVAAATSQGTSGGTSQAGAKDAGGQPETRIDATGEFVSPVRSELASKQVGRVAKILVDEGAKVRKGQVLLELETDYLRLEAERAEAELARTKAAADEARRDYERKKELLERGSVPQSLHDRSKGAFDQAESAFAVAEASLALARQRLRDGVLVSPIDGVVLERHADVGERLSEATVTFVLVQIAPLKLRFRLPEKYLALIREGQSVSATVDPYPKETFRGTVTVVGQAVDPASRSLSVDSEFPNQDGRLRPGLFARVEVSLRP